MVLICFSIDNRHNSFESVESKWKSELDIHAPNVPIILVGLKEDLRHVDEFDEQKSFITFKQVCSPK